MSEGQLEFHLKLAVDPEDSALIDFLRHLSTQGMTTRIEGDGDDLITVEVLEVLATSDAREIDYESSASRQHYIETGYWLRFDEVIR